MKPLVLDSTSILLQVKNKGKYFWTFETHRKGPTTLKGSLFEPPILLPFIFIFI
jgi:hypothetical protein